jgi:hypothetical protein
VLSVLGDGDRLPLAVAEYFFKLFDLNLSLFRQSTDRIRLKLFPALFDAELLLLLLLVVVLERHDGFETLLSRLLAGIKLVTIAISFCNLMFLLDSAALFLLSRWLLLLLLFDSSRSMSDTELQGLNFFLESLEL